MTVSARTATPDARTGAWRRRLARIGRLVARALLALLFAAAAFTALTPTGRSAAKAAMLLPALITQRQPAPLVLAGDEVRHTATTVPYQDGTVYLDVYEPASAPPPIPGGREGVVIIPGVGDNRNDLQLHTLSEALARSGVVVMDMTTPTLMRRDLSPTDGDAVIQAFARLARWPGVAPDRVGILGISAGDAPACLAAAAPAIRDRTAFLMLFGGFYDARSLLETFGRRALVVDGQVEPWQPANVPPIVLANVIAHTLPPAEGALLRHAFGEQFTPLAPAELARLSPPARAAYHLLAGDQPSQVESNLAALSPAMQRLLDALSPRAVADQIRAPIYLLHDRTDHYVPFTESRAFAAALATSGHPHDYAELGIFQHVYVRLSAGLGGALHDGASLFTIMTELLGPSS